MAEQEGSRRLADDDFGTREQNDENLEEIKPEVEDEVIEGWDERPEEGRTRSINLNLRYRPY
jgi:hypothetical protein